MSTSLRVENLRVPAAGVGRESLLPLLADLGPAPDLGQAPADLARAGGYGRPHSLLPYCAQDRYGRELRPEDVPVVVLENDTLAATFVPSLGGRLWSLVHRPLSRELLHRNPVLQPANLALRNAWVAGGVEWNLGTTGHWPLTCAPLHTVRLQLPDGTPVLRMFEFERLRRLVLCIDAWLPEGSPVLLVRVSVHNPNPETAPVYWWSNIAVPQAPDVRVVAPADHAYHYGYSGVLRHLPFPASATGGAEQSTADLSYPGRAAAAADYFFDIPANERPWIAALDGEGRGLAQVSTDPLRGRKLFQWGTGQGGRRWQEWLSGPGCDYLEIQAGLARTQLEHLPLPAGATWEWTEAYGMLETDPRHVHGSWANARNAAAEAVDALIPSAALCTALDSRPVVDGTHEPSGQALAAGSGWGALETAAGNLPVLPGTPFGDVQPEQQPWLDVLTTGRLPVSDPPAPPVTGPRWRELLEEHPADWHSRYHLGLVRYADGDLPGAREAWEQSLTAGDNPWSARCLGHLAAREENWGVATHFLLTAHRLLPGLPELTVETLRALLAADRAAEALDLLASLDGAGAHDMAPRIRLIEAQAAVAAGDLDRGRALLETGLEVPDLKEGEHSLDALWQAVRPGEPVPYRYDFRMHQEAEAHTLRSDS